MHQETDGLQCLWKHHYPDALVPSAVLEPQFSDLPFHFFHYKNNIPS